MPRGLATRRRSTRRRSRRRPGRAPRPARRVAPRARGSPRRRRATASRTRPRPRRRRVQAIAGTRRVDAEGEPVHRSHAPGGGHVDERELRAEPFGETERGARGVAGLLGAVDAADDATGGWALCGRQVHDHSWLGFGGGALEQLVSPRAGGQAPVACVGQRVRDGTQVPQQRAGLRGEGAFVSVIRVAPLRRGFSQEPHASRRARRRRLSRWANVTGSLGTADGLPARSRSSAAARSRRAAVAGTWPRGMNASGNMLRSSLAAARPPWARGLISGPSPGHLAGAVTVGAGARLGVTLVGGAALVLPSRDRFAVVFAVRGGGSRQPCAQSSTRPRRIA